MPNLHPVLLAGILIEVFLLGFFFLGIIFEEDFISAEMIVAGFFKKLKTKGEVRRD